MCGISRARYEVQYDGVDYTCSKFHCFLSVPELTFAWIFNEYPYFVQQDSRRFISQETGSLYIAKVEPSDVGNYTCVVNNTVTREKVLSSPTPLVLRSDGKYLKKFVHYWVIPLSINVQSHSFTFNLSLHTVNVRPVLAIRYSLNYCCFESITVVSIKSSNLNVHIRRSFHLSKECSHVSSHLLKLQPFCIRHQNCNCIVSHLTHVYKWSCHRLLQIKHWYSIIMIWIVCWRRLNSMLFFVCFPHFVNDARSYYSSAKSLATFNLKTFAGSQVSFCHQTVGL